MIAMADFQRQYCKDKYVCKDRTGHKRYRNRRQDRRRERHLVRAAGLGL
jgi:hypothetical protein